MVGFASGQVGPGWI